MSPDQSPVKTEPLVTKSKLARGGVWNVAAAVIPQIQLFGISISAAHFLSVSNFGLQTFIAFVQTTTVLIMTGGFPPTIMRFIALMRGQGELGVVNYLYRLAWRVELVAAAIGGGVLFVASTFSQPTAVWVLAGVGCMMGILHAVPSALLIGLQRWREASIVGLINGFFGLGLTILVLALGAGIVGMFAVGTFISTINLLRIWLFGHRAIREVAPKLQPKPELIKPIIRFACYASIGIGLEIIVWRRSELFFLKHYSTTEQIAFYSIPFSLVTAITQIPEAIASVTTPAVATLFGAGEFDRIRKGYAFAIRMSLLTALPITAVTFAVGPTAILVIYGSKYSSAGPVLLIMMSIFIFVPLITISTGLLQALNKQRFFTIVLAIAAVINIGLDFILIPMHAAIGAALANTIAQLFCALPVLLFTFHELHPVNLNWQHLLRTVIASVAAWGVAAAVTLPLGGVVELIVGVFGALVTFVLSAILLRILLPQDADWLNQLAARILRRSSFSLFSLAADTRNKSI